MAPLSLNVDSLFGKASASFVIKIVRMWGRMRMSGFITIIIVCDLVILLFVTASFCENTVGYNLFLECDGYDRWFCENVLLA